MARKHQSVKCGSIILPQYWPLRSLATCDLQGSWRGASEEVIDMEPEHARADVQPLVQHRGLEHLGGSQRFLRHSRRLWCWYARHQRCGDGPHSKLGSPLKALLAIHWRPQKSNDHLHPWQCWGGDACIQPRLLHAKPLLTAKPRNDFARDLCCATRGSQVLLHPMPHHRQSLPYHCVKRQLL